MFLRHDYEDFSAAAAEDCDGYAQAVRKAWALRRLDRGGMRWWLNVAASYRKRLVQRAKDCDLYPQTIPGDVWRGADVPFAENH